MEPVPVSGSYSQIEVTWGVLTGAQTYWEQRKSGTQGYDASRQRVLLCDAYCTKTIEGLDPETEYRLRVMAVEGTSMKLRASSRPPPNPVKPSPVLAVTTPSWPVAAPIKVAASAASSYTITGLTPETGYTVRVKSRTDLEDDGTLDEGAFTVVTATATAPAALCQACHNRYDGQKRAANRKHRQTCPAG